MNVYGRLGIEPKGDVVIRLSVCFSFTVITVHIFQNWQDIKARQTSKGLSQHPKLCNNENGQTWRLKKNSLNPEIFEISKSQSIKLFPNIFGKKSIHLSFISATSIRVYSIFCTKLNENIDKSITSQLTWKRLAPVSHQQHQL